MISIIVIGGSLGGIETLCELLAQLPSNLPAAVLAVLHTSSKVGGSALSALLERCGTLPVKEAEDRELIQPGQVYLPPMNCHLLVQDDRVRIGRGPRENNCRPAVDPLFRTAAFYARENCLGVILSGLLDDGSCGLQTIQQCGGRTLIQEPGGAHTPDMPRNALLRVKPDYLLPVAELGAALVESLSRPPRQPPPLPSRLEDEVVLTLRAIGAGPEEQALWAALRALEEKKRTLEKLRFRDPTCSLFCERLAEAQGHADQVRQLLLRLARSD